MSTNDGENTTPSNDEEQGFDPTRRRFVKNTGMVVGGLAGGSLLGGYLTNQLTGSQTEQDVKDEQDQKTKEAYSEARMFFTRFEDFVVLEQATERIFPKNDNGPGAIELGVPYFIDKQLAGPWGMNAKDYRQDPFNISDATIDQSRLTRGEIFIQGIRKMNQFSKERFDVTFDEAEEDQQVEILQDFENEEVSMKGVSSYAFFKLLRESTLEGAYADPLYGGNRNMAGWKMKEFPGAVPSYADIIENDEFAEMSPMSLMDYQQKS